MCRTYFITTIRWMQVLRAVPAVLAVAVWHGVVCFSSILLLPAMMVAPWPYFLVPASLWFGHWLVPYVDLPWQSSILRYIGRVRNMSVSCTSALPSKAYMMGIFPHGYNPTSLSCHFSQPQLSRVRIAQSTLGSFLPSPGWIAALKGTVLLECKWKIMHALRSNTPVAILPGAFREMELCKPGSDVVHLNRSHVGFLSIVQELNIPVVPAYAFGIYDEYRGPLIWTIRKFGALSLWCFPVLRRNREQHVLVTGAALHPKQYSSLEELAEAFFQAVQDLYEMHKGQYGDPSRTLHWVGKPDKGARPRTSLPERDDKIGKGGVLKSAKIAQEPGTLVQRISSIDKDKCAQGKLGALKTYSVEGHDGASPADAVKPQSPATPATAERLRSVSPIELLTAVFVVCSFGLFFLYGRFFSFAMVAWLDADLNWWLVVHISSSSLWLLLAFPQLSHTVKSSRLHRVRGYVAFVCLLLSTTTADAVLFKDLLERGADWKRLFTSASNMTLSSAVAYFGVEGVALAMARKLQKHQKVMTHTYWLLFAALTPRGVSLFLQFVLRYDASAAYTFGVAFFFLLNLKKSAHSYDRHRQIPVHLGNFANALLFLWGVRTGAFHFFGQAYAPLLGTVVHMASSMVYLSAFRDILLRGESSEC